MKNRDGCNKSGGRRLLKDQPVLRRVKNTRPALRTRKGCVLLADADIGEDQALGLIVLAVSRIVKEKGITARIGKTKIDKVAFNVARKNNLPITRSWYKYGGFVWPNFDLVNRFNEHQGTLAPSQEAQVTENLAFRTHKELFVHYYQAVEKELSILREEISDTLERIYAEDAPKPLRQVYLAHKKMTDRLSKVTGLVRSGFPHPIFLNASEAITDFHRKVMHFQDKPEVVDLVIETTSLLEDLLITYEMNIENDKKLKEWVPSFEKVLDFYHKKIWALPASAMSIETLEGPRAEEMKDFCERELKSSWTLTSRLQELSEEAYEKGVYPSKSDILEIQGRIASQIGPDEEKIRTVFAETLRIPGRQ